MSNQSDSGGINTQAVLAMRGAGYYSERTAGARDVINDARELVLTALENLSDTESLRIADFGAADGGTSQQMWSTVIEMLRKAGDNRQIEILYTDLASNDFSTLFRMMQVCKVAQPMPIKSIMRMFLCMGVEPVFTNN